MNKLGDYFSEQQAKKTIILTHRQADPDALCAAFGLGELSDSKYEIIVPQGASVLGKSVCKQLDIEFSSELREIEPSDFVVIVDAGSPSLLEPFWEQISSSPAKKILVDHHQDGTWNSIDQKFVDNGATSTCEIVTLGFSGRHFSQKAAQALLTGLMFDSQHLGLATANTLEAALTLVKAGASIEAAKRLLRSKPDRSEILARIKSAQRIQFEEFGKFIFLKSEVSSFQASVARMLLEIGADVGIAYGENEGEARVSARSTQSFLKDTGVDLAKCVKKVADSMSLIAGGHPSAASISGKASPAAVASSLLEEIKARLPKT